MAAVVETMLRTTATRCGSSPGQFDTIQLSNAPRFSSAANKQIPIGCQRSLPRIALMNIGTLPTAIPAVCMTTDADGMVAASTMLQTLNNIHARSYWLRRSVARCWITAAMSVRLAPTTHTTVCINAMPVTPARTCETNRTSSTTTIVAQNPRLGIVARRTNATRYSR